ncbi:carboxymuconolactone decarboxylase family protein [Oleiagrimonas sp. C23AA]|uniref:carboxymuconolactone decarboxylase family protein n=1 Tax=Oleiagrimonas sp. C23AA TaxID=2719047 RepID=UPI001421314D|nr:carboxymuconolactone decarboxylase family protein [Oleiagrimonas sp. C23AA]NII11809.1 carboxymuconolactone decarboxylase family protein [Oleiagrimonas sp. C23AA]
MPSRLSYQKHPAALRPLQDLDRYVRGCGLEPDLIELLLMRISQLNGCAFCLDMHGRDARAGGETEQRLYVLPAWRETDLFSAREKAALAWVESVTRLDHGGITDDVYETARAEFGERGLLDLNMVAILMNAWNRIAIPFRYSPAAA